MKEVIKTTNPHGHKDYLEIVYLEEGAGIHQIDMHRYDVNPGSLYLIMPRQIHSWELTQIPKGFVAMIKKDFLLGEPIYEKLFQSFPSAFSSFYSMAENQHRMTEIFNNIQTEYAGQLTNYQSVIKTYLQLLFHLIKRENPQENDHPYPALLKDFISLLEEHFITNHEVNFYAGKLGVSSKTLNSTCKKLLDRTVSEVINEKLIVQSKKLLLYSEATVSELSYELGFSDPSHFNKFFKRHTGVLPSIYRKGIP